MLNLKSISYILQVWNLILKFQKFLFWKDKMISFVYELLSDHFPFIYIGRMTRFFLSPFSWQAAHCACFHILWIVSRTFSRMSSFMICCKILSLFQQPSDSLNIYVDIFSSFSSITYAYTGILMSILMMTPVNLVMSLCIVLTHVVPYR